MIFGDKEHKDGETKVPDMNAITQRSNLYAYCMNNPVMFVDLNGLKVYAIGAQLAAQIGIKLGAAGGYIWDEQGNVAKVDQLSFGAGIDVGLSGGAYFAVFDTDNILDINGASFEVGGSVSPIKIGPLSLGAGYEYTASLGDVEISGNIYSANAGASLLPAEMHAQLSYSVVTSRIETIIATLIAKSIMSFLKE